MGLVYEALSVETPCILYLSTGTCKLVLDFRAQFGETFSHFRILLFVDSIGGLHGLCLKGHIGEDVSGVDGDDGRSRD